MYSDIYLKRTDNKEITTLEINFSSTFDIHVGAYISVLYRRNNICVFTIPCIDYEGLLINVFVVASSNLKNQTKKID